MEMSKVKKCDVSDCAYNMDNLCHTMAVTIGDGDTPQCDTFCHSDIQGGDGASLAGVGACKVKDCKYNTKLECESPEITVGYNKQAPYCMTFSAK